MINNKIDTRSAHKIEFLTHTFWVEKIGGYTSALCGINNSVYLEMQLSSRHFAYSQSLHDRNLESLANTINSFLGIEPNPDFVFKGKPIENERYLIYRYIKSIFQIPNDKLYLFSDDDEYKRFCNTNNLEYNEQEWFKRLYIEDDYNSSTDYLLKNSLIFQDLYFPKESRNTALMPTLHDAEALRIKYNFKDDFHQIYNILNSNKVYKLYHFTDKSNIDSIKKYGLLSNAQIVNLSLKPKYSSSKESRDLDSKMGLGNYVRLSFVKHHPMMYTSMTAYGLKPIILEINPLISLMPKVYFSDRNVLKKGAQIGGSASDLNKVRFDIVNSNTAYYDLNNVNLKMMYQAEVLVEGRIGLEMITNIHDI